MTNEPDKIDLKDLVRSMIALQHQRGTGMQVATEETSQIAPRTSVLTMLDRCDACGAKAYYAVKIAYFEGDEVIRGELMFCYHHASTYEKTRLQELVYDVTDERWNVQ